jgi:hypothetical protein
MASLLAEAQLVPPPYQCSGDVCYSAAMQRRLKRMSERVNGSGAKPRPPAVPEFSHPQPLTENFRPTPGKSRFFPVPADTASPEPEAPEVAPVSALR